MTVKTLIGTPDPEEYGQGGVIWCNSAGVTFTWPMIVPRFSFTTANSVTGATFTFRR